MRTNAGDAVLAIHHIDSKNKVERELQQVMFVWQQNDREATTTLKNSILIVCIHVAGVEVIIRLLMIIL